MALRVRIIQGTAGRAFPRNFDPFCLPLFPLFSAKLVLKTPKPALKPPKPALKHPNQHFREKKIKKLVLQGPLGIPPG